MELIKHRVAHYWSHRAEGFETQRLREYESEKRERWLTEFQKYLPQGKPLRVLDVGTGTGFFACLLAAEGHETTGIDLTPEMIEVARAKRMPGVELVVGDCEKLPFPDGSFDAVICCQSFHHYPNVQDFFDSVARVLRPGGRLILRDMTAKSAPVRWFFNHVEMPLVNLAGHGDVHVYGVEEVRALCDRAGLVLERGEKRGFFRLHCVARKPAKGARSVK